MTIAAVLSGEKRWHVQQADCLEFMAGLPADSCSLVFGSPPYEAQRTYGIGFNLQCQAWVDWMVKVYQASLRICTGLVAFVVEGKTSKFRYSVTPALLMSDLHRAGVNLRKPPIFHRVGIPGSGGPDWLRNDYEFIVCATRPGKLPWSDNTAAGHPPKWAPGGEMAHRLRNGQRANQWGPVSEQGAGRHKDDRHKKGGKRPSHRMEKVGFATAGHKDGDTPNGQGYDPPALANPGNVIHCNVGGGQMGGDEFASQNEAPFPEDLAAFFVRSFCPPDGICIDPFAGSGTTGAVSIRWGRRFLGCDVRQSQVELSTRRLEAETPMMFV